jgi:hypothetical protein
VVATVREAEERKQSPRLESKALYQRIVGTPFDQRHRFLPSWLSLPLLAMLLLVLVAGLLRMAL